MHDGFSAARQIQSNAAPVIPCLVSDKITPQYQQFDDLRGSTPCRGMKAGKCRRRSGKMIGAREKPHGRPLRGRQF